MQSHVSPKFRELLSTLPEEVRRDAKRSYRRWKADPFANGLRFKEVNKEKHLWSVRTALGWRALGIRREDDVIVWVWIGSHAQYHALVKTRRAKRIQAP